MHKARKKSLTCVENASPSCPFFLIYRTIQLMGKIMSLPTCYCGSETDYATCCKPYHEGARVPSAEALVRARFSAFSIQNYAYIVETTHPDFREDLSIEGLQQSTGNITWKGLEILENAIHPAKDGAHSFPTVTFRVYYEYDEKLYELAETSYFQEEDGILYFADGVAHRQEGYRRTSAKVGRNEPCPCGSGKKYKKCCSLTQGEN